MLQLVSMVCMYVSSKMHESQPISMEEMDLLSQRKFSREDIRKVEAQLLQVLDWRLNPPTCFTFARDFLELLEAEGGDGTVKAEVVEGVMELLQEATEDYSFVRFKSSSLAIGAVHVVWNAFRTGPSSKLREGIQFLGLKVEDFVDCYRMLLELYRMKYELLPRFTSVEESKTESVRASSPTSVEGYEALSVTCENVEEEAEYLKRGFEEDILSPVSIEQPPPKRARLPHFGSESITTH